MVSFTPLDASDPESVADVVLIIDNALQYDEGRDIRDRDFGEEPDVDV